MIITRSPLRITLGGGGTDLPSFYKKYGGFLVAGAIDKYVFTSIIKPYEDGIFLKYSKIEKKNSISRVSHPIIREALKKYDKNLKRIEITTLADVPSGTGLGSSGSFTNSLIKALFSYKNKNISAKKLAEESCNIEINKLKEPIGKQDQYISAFGGLKKIYFKKDGKVIVKKLEVKQDTYKKLEQNLLLFFTGYTRSASKILKKQNVMSNKKNPEMLKNLNEVKKIGYQSCHLLENNDLDQFGELLNYNWKKKIERSPEGVNKRIKFLYNDALNNGAIGGKLVGAGGGGFLMFYCRDKKSLKKRMSKFNIQELNFHFDNRGTKTI
tara:strand:+ start:2880 stop:3854 length:975 start_codon:yes stop_codon:yes gene_type:complete